MKNFYSILLLTCIMITFSLAGPAFQAQNLNNNNFNHQLVVSSTTPKTLKTSSLAGYINHSAITITSNDQFGTCGCTSQGNGSLSNPYIIQDYFINNQTGSGISISNTQVYFSIQHVWVNGTTGASSKGFSFTNVTNGFINNSQSTFNYMGFSLTAGIINFTLQNTVANQNNGYGYNIINANGVELINTTANNYNALQFYFSVDSNLLIKESTATGGSFGFSINSVHNSTFEHNFVSQSGYGFAFGSNTTNNFIINNSVSLTGRGLELISAYGNTLIGNSIYNNQLDGFYLSNATNNNFISNIVDHNSYSGFNLLGGSSGNSFVLNNSSYNSQNGFVLVSQSNLNSIYSNNFFGNGLQNTQDNGTGNKWYQNSFSDYNGIGSYIIAGTANTSDAYAKIYYLYPAPSVLKTVISTSAISWYAYSQNPKTYLINSNGVQVQNGIWQVGSPITLSITSFTTGSYILEIIIYDFYNRSNSQFLTVNISPASTIISTVTSTILLNTSTVLVTSTSIEVSTSTTNSTVIVSNTIFSTIIQTASSLTKTTDGFEIVFSILGLLGVLVIRHRKSIK